MVQWVLGSILHRVDPLSYFSFQPVLHDWCNKGRGMCYPVCGMMHIKEPLLLIGKSSPCGSSVFHLSLSEWSFTICLTPYNRKWNVLSASLNKTFPSFSVGVGIYFHIYIRLMFKHNDVAIHLIYLNCLEWRVSGLLRFNCLWERRWHSGLTATHWALKTWAWAEPGTYHSFVKMI